MHMYIQFKQQIHTFQSRVNWCYANIILTLNSLFNNLKYFNKWTR